MELFVKAQVGMNVDCFELLLSKNIVLYISIGDKWRHGVTTDVSQNKLRATEKMFWWHKRGDQISQETV